MLDSWVVHAYFCRWTCVKDMCVAAIADCGFNMVTCPCPVGFQAVLDEFDRENRGEAAEEEAMQERSAALHLLLGLLQSSFFSFAAISLFTMLLQTINGSFQTVVFVFSIGCVSSSWVFVISVKACHYWWRKYQHILHTYILNWYHMSVSENEVYHPDNREHWTWWLDNRFGGAQISDKPMCYPCAFCVPVASRCCAAGWTRWKHRGARCAEGHLFFKTPTKMTKARFSCCPIHTFTILHMNICRPQLLLLVNHVGGKKLSISVLLMHVGQ